MRTEKKYKVFSPERSVSELLNNCKLWAPDLEFVRIEISFLKRILVVFPFKTTIPNLFEKLQLFIKDLENLETIRTQIYASITSHKQQLNNRIKITNLSNDLSYLETFDDMAEEFFEFMEDYNNLKIKIYEYADGLLTN